MYVHDEGPQSSTDRQSAPRLDELDGKTIQLLEQWKRRCRHSQRSHCQVADELLGANRFIAIPAVLLSAGVGTGLLVTSQVAGSPHMDLRWKLLIAGAGIAAAVLTALQVSLRHFERAERHRSASARYDSVVREIEMLLAVHPKDEAEVRRGMERVQERMDSLGDQSPALATRHTEERKSPRDDGAGRRPL